MTAGTELVRNDVVRKVEIEEKCVAGLDRSDLNEVGDAATVDGNVGGNGNSNVGGNGKEDTDDSSYVFVNGSVEVSAADKEGVNVDSIQPKSDPAEEVDQFQKEELGIENEGIPVDPLVLESNGIVHGSATVGDPDVKDVKDEVNLENGSTVDPLVLAETNDNAQDVNGHVVKITGEEGQVVKSPDEVDDANGLTHVDNVSGTAFDKESTLNPVESSQVTVFDSEPAKESESQVTITQSVSNGITNVEAKTDDIASGITFDPESTLNSIENSQVTVFDSESAKESESSVTITQPASNGITDVEAKTDDIASGIAFDQESTMTPIEISQVPVFDSESAQESESQVTITQSMSKPGLINTADESSCTSTPVSNTDSEVMVNDEQEPVGTLNEKAECQETVDGSINPSENLECQVTADGSDSFGSPLQEQEGQGTVHGSNPSENLKCQVTSEDLECQVTADGPESSESPIKEQDCQVPANGSEPTDSSIDNQECPVSADVSESSGNPTEEVHSTTTDMDFDKKSEHHELFIVTSEVNVEAEPNQFCGGKEAVNQSEVASAPYTSETTKAEETVIESGTEPEENPDSGLVLSDDADALTNGKIGKIDGILEMGETQISQTEADEDVPLPFDAKKEESEEKLEKQVEGSSETQVDITEPVESETNFQEVKEHDEIQESEVMVGDDPQDGLNLEDNTVESTIEAEAPLETKTSSEPITHEDTVSLERSAQNGEILPSTDAVNPDDLAVTEGKVEIVAHLVTGNGYAEGNDIVPGTENPNVPDDEEKNTEVENHPTSRTPDAYVNSGAVIEFGSIGRHETIPNSHNDYTIAVPDVINEETKPACGADSDNSERNLDKMSDMDGIQSDEIPTSSIEDSVSDAPDAQNEESEVLPYNFLIRIPRFEDESFRDQIRSAQLLVEEKTRLRDAIRVDIQSKRSRLKTHNEAFNVAKSEETAARRLVRLKRQEIDSVQTVVNRVKNAMSVNDIDGRIYNMEHMIQHETLCLKDEKQFIREIKQLRTLRDQLALNMGSEEEVNQKDQTEEHMKALRKELDGLKEKVLKAEAAVMAVGKKYDELSRKERELQAQFRAADDVRQKAYAHLNSLKKQSYDKNKNFRLYKEDVMAARDFASRGDKDGLHRLCANQVEAFMEQWNNDDEFRNEYVTRCNLNATRRQRTLVPDDMAAHVVPTETVDKNLISIPNPVAVIPPVEQENVVSLSSSKDKHTDNVINNKSIEKEKGPESDMSAADIKKEEEIITVTKEEMELARKAEELKKEEMEAKHKEQRRLEEKAKATEALERKKRNAEKAQVRAELRARKEAEQKEKEREKRLRKKEKKKAGGDGSVNGEEAASSESSNEATTKEIASNSNSNNSVTKKRLQKPPAHFFSKQLKPKPVPPPIVNRNRKRWQQWGKLALVVVAVLVLFLLGNTGFFLNLKVQKANGGGI